MNLLSWMILVFLLLAGTSLAAVDVTWLTGVVRAIRTEYKINGQFCLAANIPLGISLNNFYQVLQNDRYDEDLQETLQEGEVYKGSNVVVAEHIGPVHVEHQVLNQQSLRDLMSNSRGHFLLIYSYLSPCGDKCANPQHKFNIIKLIRNNVLPNWNNVAFVFTTVFDDPNYGDPPTKRDLEIALEELGDSGLGLHNIFRCYKPQNTNNVQCQSCSTGRTVSEVCVEQGRGRGRETGKRERERSSSGGRAPSMKRGRPMSPGPSSSRRSQSGGRSSSRSGSRSGSRGSRNWVPM